MRKNFIVRMMCILLVILFTASVFAGCGTSKDTSQETGSTTSAQAEASTTQEVQQPLMEYTVYYSAEGGYSEAQKIAANPNDVVTPYIENKFNIKIKDIQFTVEGRTDQDFYAMAQAAGTVPDLWVSSQANCQLMLNLAPDQFADLSGYFADLPNFNKYNDPAIWPRWAKNGKYYIFPKIQPNLNNDMFASNPYLYGNSGWAMWAREDLLAKTGYKFTPIAELKKNFTDQGKYPSYEDSKIEPAIDTPEKYLDFLRKVKALNLKVGDKSVIPFDSGFWSVFHISAMFDNGHWRIDDSGNVAGFLGTPGAKPFYKLWSQMYQEGLVDKDYITQKDDQLQQKVASGLVASGLYIPDTNGARQANLQRDPAADLRPIQFPKENQRYGFFDVGGLGFYGVLISKDFKETERLVKYFDWFLSDEAQDICAWGPESAGLWEMKDGKKQFKAEVADDIINNKADGKNAVYYGLFNPTTGAVNYPNKACLGAPPLSINTQDWRLSYPVKLDVYDAVTKVFVKNVNMGVDYSGIASYGDGGENVNAVTTYYWNDFLQKDIARLLTAKTDADYDKAWDEIQAKNLSAGKYNEAVVDMTKWFQEFGAKK